ncbi:MAG TPA: hypothetical protein VMW52_05400 [Phycisphaerae bacterium]|nr:hypothetical protein [Phycisphaerae bacterium]
MADPTDAEMVSAIKAALKGTIDGNVASYAVAGRSLTRMTPRQLMEALTWFEARVARAAGTAGPAVARFREPS